MHAENSGGIHRYIYDNGQDRGGRPTHGRAGDRLVGGASGYVAMHSGAGCKPNWLASTNQEAEAVSKTQNTGCKI